MPRIKSAIRRVRVAERRRLYNLQYSSAIKTLIKRVRESVIAKDYEKAKTLRNETFSLIDRATCKGIIHRNNGANKKAKIAKWLKSIEPKSATSSSKKSKS